MSVVEPTIDDLLSVTNENRFLLCEMAARRARDINDMMRNQHSRAEQLADVEDITMFLSDDEGRSPNPLSIAFDEIAPARDEDGAASAGVLSFDQAALDSALGVAPSVASSEPVAEPEPEAELAATAEVEPAADEA
jgi:DNA-directed RNA polymerase subunit omega